MGRRTSSGRIGAPTFGGLLADAETITSDDNKDIVLDPTGTGRVLLDGDTQLQNYSDLRFVDPASGHYVGFNAPNSIASNIIWSLPSADGSQNQILKTDGTGNLSFTDAGIAITDNTSDSDDNYVYFGTATSGVQTGLRSSSTGLKFVPSTGTLTTTILEVVGNSTQRTILPETDDTYDLGSTNFRWANVYTGDLHLQNDYGSWTIIEGEENLYITNNKNNKFYKFKLEEVDSSEVPPRKG